MRLDLFQACLDEPIRIVQKRLFQSSLCTVNFSQSKKSVAFFLFRLIRFQSNLLTFLRGVRLKTHTFCHNCSETRPM